MIPFTVIILNDMPVYITAYIFIAETPNLAVINIVTELDCTQL